MKSVRKSSRAGKLSGCERSMYFHICQRNTRIKILQEIFQKAIDIQEKKSIIYTVAAIAADKVARVAELADAHV